MMSSSKSKPGTKFNFALDLGDDDDSPRSVKEITPDDQEPNEEGEFVENVPETQIVHEIQLEEPKPLTAA